MDEIQCDSTSDVSQIPGFHKGPEAKVQKTDSAIHGQITLGFPSAFYLLLPEQSNEKRTPYFGMGQRLTES